MVIDTIALCRTTNDPKRSLLIIPRGRVLSTSAQYLAHGIIQRKSAQPGEPIYTSVKSRTGDPDDMRTNPVTLFLLDIIPELYETLTRRELFFPPRPLVILNMLVMPEPDRLRFRRQV